MSMTRTTETLSAPPNILHPCTIAGHDLHYRIRPLRSGDTEVQVELHVPHRSAAHLLCAALFQAVPPDLTMHVVPWHDVLRVPAWTIPEQARAALRQWCPDHTRKAVVTWPRGEVDGVDGVVGRIG